MVLLCAAILLFSMSVSQSAPVSCDDLIKPLDQMQAGHLEGRWGLVAGSVTSEGLEEIKLKDMESITMIFSGSNQTSTYTQIIRSDDGCHVLTLNSSIHGSTFSFDLGSQYNFTGAFLRTPCRDCVVMRWDVDCTSRVALFLFLFSKRREVEIQGMKDYRAQLECLGLPPPVVMNPSLELCPDLTSSQSAADTETALN